MPQTSGPNTGAYAVSVGIVILNYNTAEAVIELYQHIICSESSRKSARLQFIIVDNASSASDVARLRSAFARVSSVKLICSSRNGGYAAGNNLGLRAAEAMRLDYCLIANSDIKFLTPYYIDELIKAANRGPDCGAVGPGVFLPNGTPQGPFPEMHVINSVWGRRTRKATNFKPVYATVGCCIFAPTSALSKVGFFDENTFLYREETVLAEKLLRAGLQWYYQPAVVVQHDHVRKLRSVAGLLAHKRFEANSTAYYFRVYKEKSRWYIASYRLLLSIKVAVMVVLLLASRVRHRGRTLAQSEK